MNFPLDFVVTWVDGSDPNWRARKRKYDSTFATSENNMNSDKAYREWGRLSIGLEVLRSLHHG